MIDDVKIGKILGYGMIGTTRLATDSRGNKYALKVEHILKKDMNETYKSPIWREIEFAKTMGEKYPDQFMRLHDYKFIDDCEHKQKYAFNPKEFPPQMQKIFERYADSPYCVVKLYDLKGIQLGKFIKRNISDKLLKSIIIQIAYIVSLMKKHGYQHGDFHLGNITIQKTNKKTINMYEKYIPTNGYLVSAIDYGGVLHKKYDLINKEIKQLNDSCYNDLLTILELFITNGIWNYIKKNRIQIDTFENHVKAYQKIMKKNNLLEISNCPKWINYYVAQFEYPEIHQKIVLGDNYPGKMFPVKLRLPKEDILFIIKNINYPRKIITYLNKN